MSGALWKTGLPRSPAHLVEEQRDVQDVLGVRHRVAARVRELLEGGHRRHEPGRQLARSTPWVWPTGIGMGIGMGMIWPPGPRGAGCGIGIAMGIAGGRGGGRTGRRPGHPGLRAELVDDLAHAALEALRERELGQGVVVPAREHDDAAEEAAVRVRADVAAVAVERPRAEHLAGDVEGVGPRLAGADLVRAPPVGGLGAERPGAVRVDAVLQPVEVEAVGRDVGVPDVDPAAARRGARRSPSRARGG